jgi:hypothetical protein
MPDHGKNISWNFETLMTENGFKSNSGKNSSSSEAFPVLHNSLVE